MSVTIDEHMITDHDDDTVIVVTEEEFQHAAQRALDALELTYTELEDQAERGEFSSSAAHALWVSIGGTVAL
jgi:hypothetical protein